MVLMALVMGGKKKSSAMRLGIQIDVIHRVGRQQNRKIMLPSSNPFARRTAGLRVGRARHTRHTRHTKPVPQQKIFGIEFLELNSAEMKGREVANSVPHPRRDTAPVQTIFARSNPQQNQSTRAQVTQRIGLCMQRALAQRCCCLQELCVCVCVCVFVCVCVCGCVCVYVWMMLL